MMRLNKELVLGLFVDHDYISTRLLVETFDVSMKTASTYLSRLVESGVVSAQFGDRNARWYYLVDRNMSGKSIIQRVIRSWQEKNHPNLKNIPEKWGGTRRGGSGHLSAIKLFVKELVALELIKD